MSLPSLINANYWTPSRTTMTSFGIQIHSKWTPTEWTLRRQMRSLPWSKSSVQYGSRNSWGAFVENWSTSVRFLPAQVVPIVIDIDRAKWEVPRNLLPPQHHSAEKQTVIRTYRRWSKVLEGWLIPNTLKHLRVLRSNWLCSWVSSNSPRPRVTRTHRLPSGWWSIPMDTGCHGTERSWPLLSTQYADQGPQRPCLHRRCTNPRQDQSRVSY